MSEQPFNWIAFITDKSVKYLPQLNGVTGSLHATILLLRILDWWQFAKRNSRDSFWKFFGPCNHNDYRKGDSWQEELGFTRSELETAFKLIGTRISKGVSKNEVLQSGEPKSAIIYWTDSTRKTFYQVNEPVVLNLLWQSYSEKPHYISGVLSSDQPTSAENPQDIDNAGSPQDLSYTGKDQQTTSFRGISKVEAPKPKRKSGAALAKQIVTFKAVTTHLPRKPLYEQVIAAIGETPDIARLKLCHETWLRRGYNHYGMDWLFEWYVNNEIPERQFNGRKKQGKAGRPDEVVSGDSSTGNAKTQLRPAKNA